MHRAALVRSPEPGPISPLPEGPRATLQPTRGPRGAPARGGGASAPGTSAPSNCLLQPGMPPFRGTTAGSLAFPAAAALAIQVGPPTGTARQDQGKPLHWELTFPQGEAGFSPSVAPVSSKCPTVRLEPHSWKDLGPPGQAGTMSRSSGGGNISPTKMNSDIST